MSYISPPPPNAEGAGLSISTFSSCFQVPPSQPLLSFTSFQPSSSYSTLFLPRSHHFCDVPIGSHLLVTFIVHHLSTFVSHLLHFLLSISRLCCLDGSSIHQAIFCCPSQSPDTCLHPVLHILLTRSLWHSSVSLAFHFSF